MQLSAGIEGEKPRSADSERLWMIDHHAAALAVLPVSSEVLAVAVEIAMKMPTSYDYRSKTTSLLILTKRQLEHVKTTMKLSSWLSPMRWTV